MVYVRGDMVYARGGMVYARGGYAIRQGGYGIRQGGYQKESFSDGRVARYWHSPQNLAISQMEACRLTLLMQ